MIIFLDSDGTIVQSISGNVGRGSSIDQVYAVAPIATATAYIGFELPNGDIVGESLMTSYSAEVLHNTAELPEGVLNVWAPGGTINFWATKLSAAVTKYSGVVKYTIRFVHSSGDVLSSSMGSFTVARGVPTLPSTPTDDVYANIQQALETALADKEELAARILSNANNISELRRDLNALGVRVAKLETGEGGGGGGGGAQRGVAIYATTSIPDATLTPDVEEGDLCICVYQAATGIYRYISDSGWTYFVGLGDGRVVVNNYAPSSGYQLQNGDVWIDTSTSTLYYSNDGRSISSVSIGSPVSRHSGINPSTFDWGMFVGTSPWFLSSGSAVGLFSFAAGCQPKLDGVTFTEPLFLFVNAHDYSSSKGIYFSTIANGTFYSCNVPCISSTISVPSVLEFTSGSGGGDKYIQIADVVTFDWAGAIKSALGINYFPSDSSQILTGEMFLNFPTFGAYVGAMGEYFTRVRVDITAVYVGMGQIDVSMTANYKGKPYTCVISSDSSGEFNLARPYLTFNEPT